MVAALCLLFVCCSEDKATRVKISDLPVKIEGDENWSFFGNDGKLAVANGMHKEPSMVINDMFSTANDDGTYSLYRFTDKPEIVKGCEKLRNVGWCNDDLIPICPQKGRICVVNREGKRIFTINPVDSVEIIETSLSFFDKRLLIISAEGKYGYIDENGRVVIKPKYYAAANFSEGKAMVEIPNDSTAGNRTYRFLDTEGAKLFDVPNDLRLQNFRFRNGRIVARKKDGTVGFLNDKGAFEPAIEEAKGIGVYNGEYYTYMNSKGLWGVMKFNRSRHIEPRYETIEILPDQSFLVQEKGGIYKVLDRNAIEKLDFSNYSFVKDVAPFGFICKTSGKTLLLNKNGKVNIDRPLSDISLNRSASVVLRTDFYNPTNPYSQLGDMITAYGIGKFKLGMPLYPYLRKDPEKYFSTRVVNPKIFKDAGDVKFHTSVIADRSIAKIIPGRSKESKYELDKEATIRMIQVDIDVDSNWRSAKIRLFNEMRNRGFRLTKTMNINGDIYSLFKLMDNDLMMFFDETSNRLRIVLASREDAKHYRDRMIQNGGI